MLPIGLDAAEASLAHEAIEELVLVVLVEIVDELTRKN